MMAGFEIIPVLDLMGGADRTSHLFGRQITSRYGGKLQTVLDRRNEGHPVLRAYYQTSFVKQYEKAETLLRTETCINDPYHLNVGRRLENLSQLVTRMAGMTVNGVPVLSARVTTERPPMWASGRQASHE